MQESTSLPPVRCNPWPASPARARALPRLLINREAVGAGRGGTTMGGRGRGDDEEERDGDSGEAGAEEGGGDAAAAAAAQAPPPARTHPGFRFHLTDDYQGRVFAGRHRLWGPRAGGGAGLGVRAARTGGAREGPV